MATAPLPPKVTGHDSTVSFLNRAIEALNLSKEISSIPPAKAVFGSAGDLLAMIKDSMVNEQDYVELGLSCADVCQALDRGLEGRRANELSKSMLGAIVKLTMTVGKIQKKIAKQGKRNRFSRVLHTKSDKDAIASWGRDLHGVLLIFNTELSMNNHMILLDLYRNALTGREPVADGRRHSTQASTPLGEFPPPPPRACFGRGELIEKVVGLAETLDAIALIGTGGIGKTAIALTVLHDDRIKSRFGDDRRFIRCDQFLPSRANFLNKLSKTIGAGIENPEDLTPLRPYLSSKKIILVLDNAECILDPQGVDGKEIYIVVEELSRLPNVYLIITSRISTIPSDCEIIETPTLSMEAARDAFYQIYKSGRRSDSVNEILEQLDYHPLSVTLLAAAARENKWNNHQLVREWEQHQTDVLHTGHNSLAATIDLSLSSPMFKELGPDARELLGVVAFFPQGVDENNLEWLFPTISNRETISNKFCVLSLAYRSNGFVTMLAPLRDYLRPRNPTQSLLLRTTKELYLTRLSIEIHPALPGSKDGKWITSEDVNVEHLLNVSASIDTGPDDIWDGCANFLKHLYWNRPRHTVLTSKIEQLPDHHPSKPQCLLQLSWLFGSLGNHLEQKRLAARALELNRERRGDDEVANTLYALSNANRNLSHFEEGIRGVKEALEIQERRGNKVQQAICLVDLSHLLYDNGKLGAAEETVLRAIDLSGEGQEFLLCLSHRLLGDVHHSKGEGEKAIYHYEEGLRIASRFNWHHQLFWLHYALAVSFCDGGKFDDAHTHITQAKPHAVYDAYYLGRAAHLHATIWYRQNRPEDATPEVSRAIEIFENLGAVGDLTTCKLFLQSIE